MIKVGLVCLDCSELDKLNFILHYLDTWELKGVLPRNLERGIGSPF